MGAAHSQSFLCGPGGDHIDEDDGGHNDLWLWWFCYWYIIYNYHFIYNILPVLKVAEEESSRGRTELSCNARRSNLLSLLLITFGVGVEYSVITFQELKAAKIYWWLTINQAQKIICWKGCSVCLLLLKNTAFPSGPILSWWVIKLWFLATKKVTLNFRHGDEGFGTQTPAKPKLSRWFQRNEKQST